MVEQGNKNVRVQQTLKNIGPAVLNGGLSTFLAFILLATSKSHVFATFFKIFFLVVIFGLYHGLVFLPVLLSIAGPKSNVVDVILSEEFKQPEGGGGGGGHMNITVNSAENIHDAAGKKRTSLTPAEGGLPGGGGGGGGGTNPNTYKI